MTRNTQRDPIGFMDSGMGGLSVVRYARTVLPNEDFVFFGDNANAPYGVRPKEEVVELALAVARKLMAKNIKALVIACNTATMLTLEVMKEQLPIPVIGIQPAVEEAYQLRKQGDVLVMATPNTIGSESYKKIAANFPQHVISLPCPGLMEFVERNQLSGEELHQKFSSLLTGIDTNNVDVVVHGCTHYPFLEKSLAPFFSKDVSMMDGSRKTLRELIEALKEKDLLNQSDTPGKTTLLTSGSNGTIELMQQLLEA